jgi:UDP-N-acetylmuramate--alanine ligase
VAIFQPHRYSRTSTFLSEFAESFDNADIVLVTDIYSAGEKNVEQITGQQVRDAIAAHHNHVYYTPTLESVLELLTRTLCPGDLTLFLGAGNLNQIIPQVMDFYQKVEKDHSRNSRELSQTA